MENIRELTRSIARIWHMHKTRESLYSSAMRISGIGHFRKICGLGYINAVLFKKEVSAVYDGCKSSLEDTELDSISKNDVASHFREEEKIKAALVLIETQDRIISAYHTLSQELDPDSEQAFLLIDHVQKLKELNELLEKETKSMSPDMHAAFVV